jgi:hypothetical protein
MLISRISSTYEAELLPRLQGEMGVHGADKQIRTRLTVELAEKDELKQIGSEGKQD